MIEPKGKIVMLANSGHRPLDTRIFQKEARTLHHAGFDVTIIIPTESSFVEDGIEIIAVSYHKKGWGKLVANPWNVLKCALRQSKKSIFHVHDSELLVTGLILKMLGRKVVYDAHEDTPQQVSYQHWIPKLLRRPYAWMYYCLEKISGLWLDAIIIAEPVIGQYFPVHKTTLIRNFPILSSFKDQTVVFSDRKKKLIYAGLLSIVRGLMDMLEGAKDAREKTAFDFVLCGQFAPQSLEHDVLKNYSVEYLSWVPYDRLIPLLFTSRVGIIIPHPIERYLTNYPVKLFEYMAAGLPVIASRQGEAAAFVKEADGGILVDPMNVQEVSAAITELMTNDAKAEAMGKRGQQIVFEKYNWEMEGSHLVKFYEIMFRRDKQ